MPLRAGEPVADVDARDRDAGRPQEAFDVADVDPGRWCYAVWAVGPNGRYARAGTVRLRHPGVDRSAARIGLTAVVAPAAGVRVRLTWTNPTAPIATSVVVLRAAGACPADPDDLRASTVATVPTTPGPATADDADPSPPAARGATPSRSRTTTFDEHRVLLEVPGVPEPPDVPPVAAFSPTLAQGSIADGTNAVRFVDASSDADGTSWRGRGASATGRRQPTATSTTRTPRPGRTP